MDQWGHTPQDTVSWIESALELGITTFDHADIYGMYTNESRFGEALAIDPSLRQKWSWSLNAIFALCVMSGRKPHQPLQYHSRAYYFVG